MVIVKNNGIIVMNRGDTWESSIFCNLGNKINPIKYSLTNNDTLYFGVMQANTPFDNSLICKKLTKNDEVSGLEGHYKISFNHEDTMHVMPGNYYYEVKLVRNDPINDTNKVDTIIPRTKFVILE